LSMLNRLFNIWCGVWFIFLLIILFPFIFLTIQVKSLHRYGTKITNFYADLFFLGVGMPVQIEHRFKPDKNKNYIFVANHFSYLDAPLGMQVVRNYFSYMGKSSVKRIPLLGYFFAKLHIQVDRADKSSRSKAMERSSKVLKEGRSLFIMPEGGIVSKEIPKMHLPFKDGAFVLAIENQVPIVPITFLNMYKIMPTTRIYWGIPRVVMHPLIETLGMKLDDLEVLKKQVYDVIQTELDNSTESKK
jgi:1-acyl-sn-glycerol-3-phosphate acyltransferase